MTDVMAFLPSGVIAVEAKANERLTISFRFGLPEKKTETRRRRLIGER